MPQLIDFSAFIFDMDGLVLDTEPTYFAAWQQAVKAMGYQLEPDACKALSGFDYRQVEAQLQAWLGHDFNTLTFKQLGAECWRNHVYEHGIMVKKGVIALLDYAQQQEIPVCLATNSSAIYVQECLAIAGITLRFPLVVTSDDVERVKPKPDIFLKAAERMQVDIHHCVVFEDSPTGILAASASGAYTVYIPSTFPVKPLTVELSDCVLDDLTQVFETLPAQSSFRI
ncbi:HAD family phosphatase [Methyloglobulus sp.]|uniref:HAD family hydrolase n=1 Tax=Methyloglobulus sp. TaxID=2518622 RepID=UPI0032B8307A